MLKPVEINHSQPTNSLTSGQSLPTHSYLLNGALLPPPCELYNKIGISENYLNVECNDLEGQMNRKLTNSVLYNAFRQLKKNESDLRDQNWARTMIKHMVLSYFAPKDWQNGYILRGLLLITFKNVSINTSSRVIPFMTVIIEGYWKCMSVLYIVV